jgi:hypothetical protein
MTPDEILEIDAKRNYPPGTQAGHLRAAINNNTRKNGGLLQQGNTLVMFRLSGPKKVDFYAFNADTPQNLAKNLEKVFQVFKKLKIERANSPYERQDIREAFKLIAKKFKIETKKEPDGMEVEVVL